MLLYVIICYYMLLYMIIYYYVLLYTVICYYTLLYISIYYYSTVSLPYWDRSRRVPGGFLGPLRAMCCRFSAFQRLPFLWCVPLLIACAERQRQSVFLTDCHLYYDCFWSSFRTCRSHVWTCSRGTAAAAQTSPHEQMGFHECLAAHSHAILNLA